MSIKKRLILILLSVGFIMALFFHFIVNATIYPDIKRQKRVTIENQWTKPQVAISEEERSITTTESKLTGLVKKHTRLYIIFTVLSIIFLGFLVYFLIEKYITKRISRISLDMKSVRGLKDISMRITLDRKGDEISSLIANINETLDKIEREKKSREEIEKLLITREKLVSVGRLAATIAHEINSPMLAISNCIQALKRECLKKRGKDNDLTEKAITLSESEINRIRNIVSSLLDFQRSDVEELTEVNLDEVIRQSQEVLGWSNKLSSIKIITEKQQDFFIMGFRGRLKQVFINFILNAAEAASNNNNNIPELRIEILPSKDKDFCEVHFKDNGPGILPQIKNKIFEPFTSTKEGKSVGLGLYVSYKIIKDHQGEILYDDTYKKGAHFIIKLPVKERYS